MPPPIPNRLYLTDSGLETDLVFNHGIDLPCFAAFPLLRDANGRDVLTNYFLRHLDIARAAGTGFVLESVTWRASSDWAAQLGIDLPTLDSLNHDAITMLLALKQAHETSEMPISVSGCIGPRGDGYVAPAGAEASSFEAYHLRQATSLAAGGAELLSAITMTSSAEAIGIARAARRLGLPAVVSFTVETDGRLPSGETLADAVAAVDADAPPLHYMINCAHPSHFATLLATGAPWLRRLRGLRANASRLSHAELDVMTELDAGDCADLAADYAELRRIAPQLTILGGCCGTDARHIAAIAKACAPQP